MTTPKKRTLIILSPGFPRDELDSTCLPAQQIFIRALNRLYPDLEIVICAFEYPFQRQQYNWHGNTVYPFNSYEKGKVRKLLIWSAVWKKLRWLKKSRHIVGILSFWLSECALIGKYFARFYHLRHLCWILGQDARKGNRFVPWFSPKAGDLVAMSDFLAEEFNFNYHVRPEFVVPNGIDVNQFTDEAGTRCVDVLGVGSLIALKQYDLFIDLVGKLKTARPTIQALICGEGPEKEELGARIRKLGLEENIRLTGEKSHPEVLALMKRSRVLLHPSSYEGFSSVCLEALFAGAHVVSFFCPMRARIEHWHIAENKEHMVQTIEDLLGDSHASHEPVLPYQIEDSARTVMNLLGKAEVQSGKSGIR